MEENDFFNSQTPSSLIKAKIVAEYFPQYARIIAKSWGLNLKEIRYLDLFSGPGIYQDGSMSTPMLIAQSIAQDSSLSRIVQLAFNDNTYIENLETNFLKYFPTGTFLHNPRFGSLTVGEDTQISEFLVRQSNHSNKCPTLLFFDPWGYKGIDTAILGQFLLGGGNEMFLFVNIKRIHAALENEKFEDLMKSLFPNSIDALRRDRKYLATPAERLSLIIDNLADEFRFYSTKDLFVSRFKFQEEDSSATSHYILHFTKHPKGYELVKQIFNDFDNIGASLEQEGCYAFDAKRMYYSAKDSLDFGDLNVDTLAELLSDRYQGETIAALDLFKQHQTTGNYSGTHYTKALRQLVEKGSVEVDFTDAIEHRVSVLLINTCILKFK